MPTPRKERFLAAHRDRLGVPLSWASGGRLTLLPDMCGELHSSCSRMGLEWLYRVYQEPRRMWWRYAKTNTLFAAIMIRAMIDQDKRGGLSRLG